MPDLPVLSVPRLSALGAQCGILGACGERPPQAVYVTTADAAIEALKTHEFRAVFLDHDLHWMHVDNTIVKGTGKEVALHLKKTGFPGVIVIHSKHDEAAEVMQRILPHAKRARFEEFEINVIAPAKKAAETTKR
jgi:predicted HAD superfamily phosphohydrolase YqeG